MRPAFSIEFAGWDHNDRSTAYVDVYRNGGIYSQMICVVTTWEVFEKVRVYFMNAKPFGNNTFDDDLNSLMRKQLLYEQINKAKK